MPRKPKPPAVPVEMPRTERDLDILMRAVETHMAAGHKIGDKINLKTITSRQALDEAAKLDEVLYNVLDTIQAEREGDLEKMIDDEKEDGREEGE